MHRNIFKLGLLVALGATLCAAQQSSVQKEGNGWTNVVSGSLAGARNLRIKVEIGAVRVLGGSNQGITYAIHNHSYEASQEQAQRQFEHYKISATVRGDTAWIVGSWEEGRPHKFNSDITVNVPRDVALVKIETEGGQIITNGISGRLEAQSGGGAIELEDIGGAIEAETGGGHINVGNAGSDVTVRTGGGNIHIGSAKGKVVAESGGGSVALVSASDGASLETGGGSIHVDKCVGKLKVSTGGGNIDLGDVSGGAEIETGGGTVKLVSATGSVKADSGGGCIELWGVPSARVETGAGTITAKFIPGGTMDSELETGVGDITVYLAANLHTTVEASIEAANGHSISSEFSEIKVSSEGGQWGPKMVTAEGSLNGGGPMLKVRTTMGNIYIKKAQ